MSYAAACKPSVYAGPPLRSAAAASPSLGPTPAPFPAAPPSPTGATFHTSKSNVYVGPALGNAAASPPLGPTPKPTLSPAAAATSPAKLCDFKGELDEVTDKIKAVTFEANQSPATKQPSLFDFLNEATAGSTAKPVYTRSSTLPAAARALADHLAMPSPGEYSLFVDFEECQLFPAPAGVMQFPCVVEGITERQKQNFATFIKMMASDGHRVPADGMYMLAADYDLVPKPFFVRLGAGAYRMAIPGGVFTIAEAPRPIFGNPEEQGYVALVFSALQNAINYLSAEDLVSFIKECSNYIEYGHFKSEKLGKNYIWAGVLQVRFEQAKEKIMDLLYGGGGPIPPDIKDKAREVAKQIKERSLFA